MVQKYCRKVQPSIACNDVTDRRQTDGSCHKSNVSERQKGRSAWLRSTRRPTACYHSTVGLCGQAVKWVLSSLLTNWRSHGLASRRGTQGRIQDFGLGGALARDLGDGSPPEGSRGRALVGVWGISPQKSEECYVKRLNTLTERKKQVNTDWQCTPMS